MKNRRLISMLCAIAMSLTLVLPVSAANIDTDRPAARLMPTAYTYTNSVIANSSNPFPPGYAKFDVTITGLYDAQGDNVISIDSAACVYRGGVNCTGHDVEVETWTNAANRGYVFWKLVGTITISWTSPVTGIQYEQVEVETPSYSFRTSDY